MHLKAIFAYIRSINNPPNKGQRTSYKLRMLEVKTFISHGKRPHVPKPKDLELFWLLYIQSSSKTAIHTHVCTYRCQFRLTQSIFLFFGHFGEGAFFLEGGVLRRMGMEPPPFTSTPLTLFTWAIQGVLAQSIWIN